MIKQESPGEITHIPGTGLRRTLPTRMRHELGIWLTGLVLPSTHYEVLISNKFRSINSYLQTQPPW